MTIRNDGRALWPWYVLASIVAVVIHAVTNAIAIKVIPDGWAYWQGAVSLAEGHGYRFLDGTPIVAWPPLYSLYLSIWARLLGGTTVMLSIANGALLAGQASAWTWCILQIWQHSEPRPRTTALFALTVYVAAVLTLNQQIVEAETLKYLLIAPLLLTAWRAGIADTRARFERATCACAILGCVLVATHHAGVVFVGSSAILVAAGATRRHPVSHVFLASLLIVTLPLLTFIGIRIAFYQWGSHSLRYVTTAGLLNSIRELAHSISNLVAGANVDWYKWPAISFALVAVFLARRMPRDVREFLVVVIVSALLLSFVIFNAVSVDDTFSERFVLIAPLLMTSFGILTVATRGHRVAFAIMVMGALLPQVIALAITVRFMRHLDPADPGDFVMHTREISTRYLQGPPVWTGSHWLIPPDPYRAPTPHPGGVKVDW